MTPPVGMEEVIAFYGDPSPWMDESGQVSGIWETNMRRVPFPAKLPLGWTIGKDKDGNPLVVKYASSAFVHKNLEQNLTELFRTLAEEGLWRHLRTYDGAYTWRTQRGSATKLSMHSFGAALDFDAATNKLGQRKGDINRGIVTVFELYGWTWGGRFHRPDMMHFQYAKSA